jgi:hypothetical protein
MNLNRILINESEKQRILGLHTSKKQLIREAVTRNDMPICVRNAGELLSDGAGDGSLPYMYINVPNAGGKGVSYRWYGDHTMYVTKPDASTEYKYYCKCVEGKCKPKTYSKDAKDIPDECDDKRKCSLQTPGGQVETPGGKVDVNCKNKSPYNAFTDAGLNWKEESRKWIEAKCNGTTPCILGNAQTNINLRNAFCDGTWGSKKENPSLNPACSSKCAEQPKVVPPGSIVTQQIGYFYDSTQGKCVGVTGQNGPFGSIAECEACKCGSQGTIGDGGQKPGDGGQKPIDGGNKLPDFIPPTIIKPRPLD